MKNLRFRYRGREQQTVYDLAEKHDSGLDLIEKIPAKVIWSTNKLKSTTALLLGSIPFVPS